MVAGDPLHARSLVEVACFYGAYCVQALLMLPWNPPLSNYRLLTQVQRPLLPTLTRGQVSWSGRGAGDGGKLKESLGMVRQVEAVFGHRLASHLLSNSKEGHILAPVPLRCARSHMNSVSLVVGNID